MFSHTHNSRWYALIVVMSGVFLTTMDSGMVNIAMPSIMRHFGLAIENAEYVVTVYLTIITVSLVFWGRIADRKGLEKIYTRGLLVFSAGAWCCYFSNNFSFLLVFRAIQGLGASMMMSSGPAIIKTSFPVKSLGRNLGLVGIATAAGLLSGPFVSGHLLAAYSWKSIFALLGVLSFVISCNGAFLFRKRIAGYVSHGIRSFDWPGSGIWVVLVISGLHFLQTAGGKTMIAAALELSIVVVLLVLFVRIEKKMENPILPLSIFRKKFYWVGVTTTAISFLCLFSVLVLLPFYFDYVLHFTSAEIGSAMMAVPATLILLSPAAGFLYDKFGARFLTSFGLLTSCIALVLLSTLSEKSTVTTCLFLLATLGAGQSIFLSPNSASVLSKVGDERVGATAGVLATARNLGMVTGAALATVLFSLFGGADGGVLAHGLGLPEDAGFLPAFSATLKSIAAVAVCGCLISTLRD